MSIRCLSSMGMSKISEWRNPPASGNVSKPKQVIKKIVAEAGYIALTLTSLIETIAYAVLALITKTFSIFSPKPATFFVTLLKSSSFAIVWGIHAIICNPTAHVYPTQEYNSEEDDGGIEDNYGSNYMNVMANVHNGRVVLPNNNPVPQNQFYPGQFGMTYGPFSSMDRVGSVQQNNADEISPELQAQLDQIKPVITNTQQATIDAGASFIKGHILTGLTDEKKDVIASFSPEVLVSFLTKAVYLYVLGSQRFEDIPKFFQEDTVKEIADLRKLFENASISNQVIDKINNLDEIKKEDLPASLFDAFEKPVHREMQGVFITECMKKAFSM